MTGPATQSRNKITLLEKYKCANSKVDINVCVQGGVLNDSLLYLAGADYHHHCFFEWTQTLMLHLTGIPLWLKTEAQYIGLTVKKTEEKY